MTDERATPPAFEPLPEDWETALFVVAHPDDIEYGGAAAVARWTSQGKRIVAVHVKDIARPGQGLDEDGWSDVGHGTIDWASLLKALRAKTEAKYFVMEQDNPNDFERFARRSIESVKTY